MIFSVFDHHSRRWHYYEAPGTAVNYGSRGTKYRAPTQPPQGSPTMGAIGFAPESLGVPLPSNARRVGSGAFARGLVAAVPFRVGSNGLNGLNGVDVGSLGSLGSVVVGTDAPVQPGQTAVIVKATFGQTIAAACVAAVVGVLVQRALR